jgi:predicted GNAT family N-acyltransferase
VEQHVAAVWLLYDSEKHLIAGYYTLSAMVVQRVDLASKMPHRIAQYEVYPATLIGRLAADLGHAGERIGERLLYDALSWSLVASQQVASLAVVTDAKNGEVQAFYEHYGFIRLQSTTHERRLFLPMKTVEELFGQQNAPE